MRTQPSSYIIRSVLMRITRIRQCFLRVSYDISIGMTHDPLFKIRSARRAGKRVLLWWWREPREFRDQGRWVSSREGLASDSPKRLLRRLERRYAMARIELPHAAAGWECYELVEK